MSRPVAKITGATTLDSSYAGYDVLATGGAYAITLAAPTSDGSDIRVINGDALSGKVLVGFPAPFNSRNKLWPRQTVGVSSVDGSWFTTQDPGRWMVTETVKVYVSSLPGASNNNDGLSPSTPLRNLSAAVQMCQKVIDTQQTSPIIAPIAGSVFQDDPINLGGQPTGGNLIQLSVYGNGQVQLICDYVSPINIGDNAELNIDIGALNSGASLLLWGCRANGNVGTSAGIYQHNNGLFDMEGSCTIIGNSPNHSAFFFDGPCPGASIANGFNLGGYFGDAFRMDEGGGRFTVSGPVNAVPWSGLNPTAARLYGIYDHNKLLVNAGYGGSWASLGASLASGHGRIVKFGTSIPGGVTATQYGLVTDSK